MKQSERLPRQVIHGDALHLDRWIAPRRADLAYLDPPFSVGIRFRVRRKKRDKEKDVSSFASFAFADCWPSIESYLEWMKPRIIVAREILSSEGTLWLHLDYRAIHEAKLLCDHIFGRTHFLGEVIWTPGNGGRSVLRPSMTHQTLLLYRKGKTWIWNYRDPCLRESYARTSLTMHFSSQDSAGRRYRERVVGQKRYRYYADEGRAIGSVWTDCPAMVANAPLFRERTGYPTQKPEKLMERIIRASTHQGALIIDPFCGSGTTLYVAARLGRSFVGCDSSPIAIDTVCQRLRNAGISFKLQTMQQSP
ncbi:hypothetical protein BCY86_04745 [Pajaroellobacter abortibovis]|uniref:site-specific DNA-methyltransferase (adenine-specific) n=2 Tax=Pajaroellobacter abortibovis TaxID=1882918 RepID=A0A1L6MZS7_9BACT|nr:hypothetical protein BCY86_04745 [Pajaroellobacter abortibovis]